MKSKLLSLFLLTAILLSVVMVSAATNFTVTQPDALTKSTIDTVVTFTIDNTAGVAAISVPQFADIEDGDGHTITVTQTGVGSVATGNSEDITLELSTTADLDDLALGTHSESIVLTDGVDNETVTLNFNSGFCEIGEVYEASTEGDRILEIVHVKDRSSEDDWEWKPLDEVEIEVKVKFENDGDEDDDIDVIIEIGLYDTEDNTWIDLNHDEDLEREVSLDEGESKRETFTITIPVEDVEDSNTRYRLYAKVYDDEDGEDNICSDNDGGDYYQQIKIEKESYEIILTDVDYSTPVPCGEEVEITAKIHNTGTHDEDKVIVTMYNKELGLDNIKSQIYELDEGDSDKVLFNFIVPENAEEKVYSILLYTSYKYSKSSEQYREDSKDYIVKLKVQGNCQAQADAQITAELDEETPDAIAGEQVIIKATIKNTGDETATYTISTSGASTWSSLIDIDPETVTLDAGESEDVSIILELDAESEGEQEFTIKASVDGELVKEQKVALTVETSKGLRAGITGGSIIEHVKDNGFIYAIVIINLILIIAIISVVRRMTGTQIPAR